LPPRWVPRVPRWSRRDRGPRAARPCAAPWRDAPRRLTDHRRPRRDRPEEKVHPATVGDVAP
jgi:hypothetical protein